MLRRPRSLYVAGRSATLIKVKRFHDAEARVVGHQPGHGRHRGRLGALLVQMVNRTRFAVGSGLSDAERDNPPAIGSLITFKYQELSDGGVPRFPTYVGVRADANQPTNLTEKGNENMATLSNATRRFEFVGGGSDKFYEVTVNGTNVTVCFGRNGTQGQTQSKTLTDDAAAQKHAAKLVREKLGKGYREVA